MDNYGSYGSKYTVAELDAAWEQIHDPEDWRKEIRATILTDDFDVCNEACINWTGTALEVIGSGSFSSDEIVVWSVGYRNGPAGP